MRRVSVRIDVFTIFPGLVEGYCETSLLGRARQQGIVDLRVRDLRAAAADPRRSVDDAPFGGGAGMVLMPEPVFAAVEAVESTEGLCRPLLLLSPGGRRFDQAVARELACSAGFSLLCGRYEGVDQRVADHLVDGELSVGDVVLAGGELAALVVVEAVGRLLPGVLGNEASAQEESFADGLLEHPQYTRPASFRGWTVPEVLRSGDHGAVARWRRLQALRRTLERRPDLVEARGGLRPDELVLLAEAAEAAEAQAAPQPDYDAAPGTSPAQPKDAPYAPD
jgi:tRNA (guanine37-N1)-methyltransferase